MEGVGGYDFRISMLRNLLELIDKHLHFLLFGIKDCISSVDTLTMVHRRSRNLTGGTLVDPVCQGTPKSLTDSWNTGLASGQRNLHLNFNLHLNINLLWTLLSDRFFVCCDILGFGLDLEDSLLAFLILFE